MLPLSDKDIGLLYDIVAYGERAVRHIGLLTQKQFIADEKTYDSVVRCLAIVGEATWKMSREVKGQYKGIPWHLVSGLRHRLVHDYGSVDEGMIFRIVHENVPSLISEAQEILAQLDR